MTKATLESLTPSRFRERRQALRMTQVELAAKIGVTSNTVARWERGERKARIPGAIDALLAQLEREVAMSSPSPTPQDAPAPAFPVAVAPPVASPATPSALPEADRTATRTRAKKSRPAARVKKKAAPAKTPAKRAKVISMARARRRS